MLSTLFWFLVFVGGALALAYRRTDLRSATMAAGAALVAYLVFGDGGLLWNAVLIAGFAGLWLLNNDDFRRERVTRPVLKVYRKLLPNMSATEREALQAGTVWWDGELFGGTPNWNKLLATPKPTLSKEEQAFLDGPVEELCRMIDDWKITHELGDLTPEIWQFLKDKGFFAMIIPKKYGGLEFSALAHSEVLMKVSGMSATVASTIAVPNSLGPAELLHQYGTSEQKNHYLPRLARGEEIPCFGLTSNRAGSDATSLSDTGVVCKGTFNGEETLGIRLNWNKRYITLAPVATILGLAFKLYDPDHLIGDKDDYGITVALVPTDLPGVTHGRRHYPLNVPFQNGPISGEDVFVPLSFIIGGREMAGQGWRMLVECLTVGRCISLPANTTGGAKAGVAVTGSYGRVRRQFNMPVGRFEGVQKVIARIAGKTYQMDAVRNMTAGAVDLGEAPSVPSAIIKYHVTELAREVSNDVMDVHGGKGIMLGPKNYLGRAYQAVPISITVEGANILTRSMIIYGQGAIRCHPFVLKEMTAAANEDREQGLHDFDDALFGHIGLVLGNAARSFWMGLTLSRYNDVPVSGPTRRYYQHINRFSAAFALLSDAAMATIGGNLKKKEMLSGRLGDILSYLYLASSVLKRFEDQGRPAEDLPLVEWACRDLLYKTQERLHNVLRNFPNRWVAGVLRVMIFPRGRLYHAPGDRLEHKIAELMIRPSDCRARLIDGIYQTNDGRNPIALLDEAMRMTIAAEPLEKKLRRAIRDGVIKESNTRKQIDDAVAAGVLTEAEGEQMHELDAKVLEVIVVDDFDSADLAKPGAASDTPPVAPRATRKDAADEPMEVPPAAALPVEDAPPPVTH
ncbi:MAG: acyl-CoA dehydrogenase [Pseudomonadota bacterium]